MTTQPPTKALLRALAIWLVPLVGLYILIKITMPTVSREASRPQPSSTPGQATATAPAQVTKADAPAKIADDPERARVAEAKRLADKWTYQVDEDPMTSRKWRFATIQSENTVNFGFPYQGEQHGSLVLRNHPTHGRAVVFTIEKGQLPCTSYEGCAVRVRFDEGTPERWSASGPADHSTTSLFLRGEPKFVQKLQTAKVVRIQVRAYQQGEPIFEFHVGGFDNARYKGSNLKVE